MIEQAIQAFINKTPENISSLSGGHINDSFIVTAEDTYVLQRINSRLYAPYLDTILNNYTLYKRSCDNISSDEWICPKWLTVRDGGFFYCDEEGSIWRMYKYIPSDDKAPLDIYEIGKGLGRLHLILEKCDGITSIDPNRHLYDLSYHYRRYRKMDEKEARDATLDPAIEDHIKEMADISIPEGDVIHGDAKISNMVYNGRHVVGFIDLDTIMPGSVFNDLADCARSCCLDKDNKPDKEKIADMIRGYEAGRGMIFTENDLELLCRIISRNMFILCLRYYTDVLSQEGYFADLDDEQKLRKARMLLP